MRRFPDIAVSFAVCWLTLAFCWGVSRSSRCFLGPRLHATRLPLASTRRQAKPYADLEATEPSLQRMLATDIGRRNQELTALAWLGRAYLAVPFIFDALFPAVFNLDIYDDDVSLRYEGGPRDGIVECTLKESSVVARGIPLRLRFSLSDERVSRAVLLGIGCDLKRAAASGADLHGVACLSTAESRRLCDQINTDQEMRQLVVRAIVDTVSRKLARVPSAIAKEVSIELVGSEYAFVPRHDAYGLEGSSEKWVQKVSEYYFAEARLQEVRFAGEVDDATFTFYFDAAEPVNSDKPGLNVNPEVLCCNFNSEA
mmetsp:Transcript_17986/g.46607  ORF Transcript_17986/g.46607 Transcript_17986/m.46607 type:complete len:313 (-) Transcript_17986:53-991(-)